MWLNLGLTEGDEMDKCSKCGADASLYESGKVLCFKCSEQIEAARKQTARTIVAERERQKVYAAVAS